MGKREVITTDQLISSTIQIPSTTDPSVPVPVDTSIYVKKSGDDITGIIRWITGSTLALMAGSVLIIGGILDLSGMEGVIGGGHTEDSTGLNADMVDGYHAIEFLKTKEGNVWNPDQSGIDFQFKGGLDTNLLYVDSDTSSVGIGTDAPSRKFFVNGTSGFAGSSVFLDDVIVNENGLNKTFRVEGDNNETLIYTDAANDRVGIGTNNPQAQLDIKSDFEQLRLSRSGSEKAKLTVDSGGSLRIEPTGDVILGPTGFDILPLIPYTTNIGANNKKFLTLWVAELWAEILVAVEKLTTIGGRVLIAPSSELTGDVPSVQFSTMGSGDVSCDPQNPGDDFLFSFRISIVDGGGGETLSSVAVICPGNAPDPDSPIIVTWVPAVGASAYKVYGRTFGSELYMTTVSQPADPDFGSQSVVFLDDGSITPLGAVPASNTTTLRIALKHNFFANGEIVFLEDVQSSGAPQFEAMKITSAPSTTAPYVYTVTRNFDGSGINDWNAGAGVASTGIVGDGYIDLYSLRSVLGQAIPYVYNFDASPGSYSVNYGGIKAIRPFTEGVAEAPNEINDAILFGHPLSWENAHFDIDIAATYTGTIVYEFWNGSAWTSFVPTIKKDGVVTGSALFSSIGVWSIEFTAASLTGWVSSTVNSVDAFWIRVRISVFTSWTASPKLHNNRYVHFAKKQFGPAISFNVRTGTALFGEIETRAQAGNLSGTYDYASDVFGFAAGKATGNWLSMDETSGFRVMNNTEETGRWFTNSDFRLGASSKGNLFWDNTSAQLNIRNSTTSKFSMNTTGTRAGSLFLGSDTASDSSIYFALFGGAFTFNSEASVFGAGDLLLGSNSALKANIFYDNSAGKLNFRGGTTTQAYIDTDGTISAGLGTVLLNSTGLTIVNTGGGPNNLLFKTNATSVGYMRSDIVSEFNRLHIQASGSASDQDANLVISATAFPTAESSTISLLSSQEALPSIEVNTDIFRISGAASGGTDFRVDGNTTDNVLFVDASFESVGIGTNVPSQKLTVAAPADPTVRINEGASTTSYTDISDLTAGVMTMNKVTNSGSAEVNIQAIPSDGTSSAQIRLFRNTNTSGSVNLAVLRGNNTNTTNAVISGAGHSYVSIDNGNFGVGTSAPDTMLDLNGTLSFTPSAAQAKTAASNTILCNSAMVIVDPNANLTLTSAPTIANGAIGQTCMITSGNAEANTVTVQDQGTLANSNLELAAATRVIGAKDVLVLLFDGTDWLEVSYSNN